MTGAIVSPWHDADVPAPTATSTRASAIRRRLESIWHIRGDVTLDAGQSDAEVFERLAPLFGETGTTVHRTSDTLSFTKKDAAAQDIMAVFDSGTLAIGRDGATPVLRYHLVSRALLCCFLAPLLFLAFAQVTKAVAWLEGPAAAEEKKDKKQIQLPQNPIDKALGSPAPEKPDAKKKDEKSKHGKTPKPDAAYVFAGIFAVLYVVGRWLESHLIAAAFTKRLRGAT